MVSTTARHPCFDSDAKGTCARVHLPVAAACNIQCRFCNRKYDCVNESRPGVTSAVLQPEQAVMYLDRVLAREPRTTVVGIAGPGDPFATPQTTLQTLQLVRQYREDLLLCVASNGLNVASFAQEVADVGVSHFTLTINAVDPAIGQKIYSWVRPGRLILRGLAAAETLLDCQLDALRALKRLGITVKVNTIVIPGVNDQHVAEVARVVASLGADKLNCIALLPTAETEFEALESPSAEMMQTVRGQASVFLPQMTHCSRCRSDAVGILGQDRSAEFTDDLRDCASGFGLLDQSRPYVAVASWEGMLVNQHLGEAAQMWIFKPGQNGYDLVEVRETPTPGGGVSRWDALASRLSDCRCILASGAGENPKSVLKTLGVPVVEVEGVIEEGLDAAYKGGDFSRLLVRKKKACQAGCTGAGGGCG